MKLIMMDYSLLFSPNIFLSQSYLKLLRELSDIVVLIVIAQSVAQAVSVALVHVLTKVGIGRHDRCWALNDRLLTQL